MPTHGPPDHPRALEPRSHLGVDAKWERYVHRLTIEAPIRRRLIAGLIKRASSQLVRASRQRGVVDACDQSAAYGLCWNRPPDAGPGCADFDRAPASPETLSVTDALTSVGSVSDTGSNATSGGSESNQMIHRD